MKTYWIFRRALKNFFKKSGAGNETRTRDTNLGKVVLYQLSYSRLLECVILVKG